MTGRDGETGPVEIDIVKRRVQTRLERTRTGPQAWLVVTRRPLADEGTREPRASRDASDQDAWYAYRDDLPPTQTPASEVEEPSLVELARVIKAGVWIAASFTRGTSDAGLDASQVRTWEGGHHHMTLAVIAVWFLIGATHRGQPWTPALTLPQVRDGRSVLRLEVFCTLTIPSICRQVHRQFMRNALARLYYYRTRNCLPPRKLRIDIQ